MYNFTKKNTRTPLFSIDWIHIMVAPSFPFITLAFSGFILSVIRFLSHSMLIATGITFKSSDIGGRKKYRVQNEQILFMNKR